MAEVGEALSDRERDVLELVMRGASNKEIALELDISPNTVKVHLRNIYVKLGASSRTEASMIAVERGLFESATDLAAVPLVVDEPDELADEATAALPEPMTLSPVSPTAALPHRNWWRYGFIGLLVLLIAAVAAAWATNESGLPFSTPATPTPFAERELNEPRWFLSRPLPEPRAHAALVAVGSDLYQIGGESNGVVTNEVLIYATNRLEWRRGAPKLTAVADAAAADLLAIYVVGGRGSDGRPTAVVEAYSPVENSWQPVASLPKPIVDGLALADDRFLYLFGGSDGERPLKDAYIYDPTADGWRAIAPMKHARAGATGGVIDGKFYVVGGGDEKGALTTCEVYDRVANSWESCPSLSVGRQGAGAAVVLDQLFVLGGDTAEAATFGEVLHDGVWQIINVPDLVNSDVALGWADLGVTSVEARIYAVGGRMLDGPLSAETVVYTPAIYQTFIPSALSGAGSDD